MSDFLNLQSSSHFSHWIFTPELLEKYRNIANIRAKENPSIRYNHLSIDPQSTSEPLTPLTPYCRTLQYHFLSFLSISIGFYKDETVTQQSIVLPLDHWRVSATAIEYFKRFYIHNSMIAYDPRLVMLGCLFLAGKSDHRYIDLKDLSKIYDKCSEQDILDHEIIVLEGLGFELKVFHSINCSHTLLADYKKFLVDKKVVRNKDEQLSMRKWEGEVYKYLVTLQLTDATLLFNPVHIAICGLMYTEPEGLTLSFQTYIIEKFSEIDLLEQCQSIHQYFLAKKPSDEEKLEAMTILKKQKIWGNPSKKRNRENEA